MPDSLETYIAHIQREDDIFAKAQLLRILVRDQGHSIKSVAEALHLSSAYVCNLLRALKLPDLVRDGYYSKLISPTHLFIIARLPSEDAMVHIYEEVLQSGLSTTALDERVRQELYHITGAGSHSDTETFDSIQSAIQAIDPEATVKVIQTRIKTKIVIERKGNLEMTSGFLKKFKKKLDL